MNALAVRIVRVANPGSTKDKAGPTVNGGALGRDNPTYHASAGWDWMSTIRGRDTGIWSNVSITTSGPVKIEDPLVTTTLPLPDTTHADVTIRATLRNLDAKPVTGTLRARFGSVNVEMPVTIDASSTKAVEFSPATQAALRLVNPKLWWPVGYGEPNLYPVSYSFVVDGAVSDQTSFNVGVRQFTYSEDGGVLKIWINGRRFIARGGNWGFPESMLRYRSREYDAALRYHRDEHFNMIRNWVGQTGDEAFYDAADRYGVVVWQDFWLANPWDGPDPDDNELFLANAKDYLLRIRNHASLGIFCGRNEGFPPQPIDDGLRDLVATLEPGSHYISSSADGPVSGHGPYRVEPLRYYFEHAPTKLHSEMGSPNVVEMDDLRRTMPESAMWPQGYQWPLHDYHEHNPFTTAVEKQYGGATDVADWVSFAQFVDYDAYRGMFEGQSKNRLGLLIWMSHPAWPSLLVADIRLLLRHRCRILWGEKGRGASAHPVECGDRRGGSGELQRRRTGWTDGPCAGDRHRRDSEMGEERGTRQPRGQYCVSLAAAVPSRAGADTFHSPVADARRRNSLLEFLSAWTCGRRLPGNSRSGRRKGERKNAHHARW